MKKIKTTKERFYEKVGLDWQWLGYKNDKGYGQFIINNNHYYAHRISYEIHKGKIPEDMHVLHSCDDPGCVNPEHLHLGTAKDNAKDREEGCRGNHVCGEKSGRAILVKKDVLSIRKKFKNGISINKLAKEYSVSAGAITGIIYRNNWKHI